MSAVREARLADYYVVMRLRRLIPALFLIISSVFMAALPVSAHTDLVSTSPTDGANVGATPPATIEVTFNEPTLLTGSAIVLNDASGNEVKLGELTQTGSTLSVAVPPDLPSGKSTVTWRTVADDGHVITGTFSFTVGAATASASESVDPTMTAYATDTPQSTTTDGVAEKSSNSNSWIILLAAFVTTATIASIYVKKKRK